MYTLKRLFKFSSGLAIATVLLIVYQNFSGLPDSTKFATKKPMPAQDIDPFSKTNITDQEYAYIALLKTNNLIYNTYIEQANLTKEADYNLNYATKIAVSNSTFIDINAFNQVLPDNLPLTVASIVYRGTVYINGVPATDSLNNLIQATFTLAMVPEKTATGNVIYVERLVSTGHSYNLNDVNASMSIVLDGPNDSAPIATYKFTPDDISRVQSQIQMGGGSFDFITLTPPTEIINHPDAQAALNSGLLPVVDGGAISKVTADMPMLAPGYSMIYNLESLVAARQSVGAGRVQPDTQVVYLGDTSKNLIQTVGQIGGAVLSPDVGHSGGPLLVNIDGRWTIVGVLKGGDTIGPDLTTVKMMFVRLPDSAGRLEQPTTNSDVISLFKSAATLSKIEKLKEKVGANSTSCIFFGNCAVLDVAAPTITKVVEILKNQDTARIAAAAAKKRIQSFVGCFAPNGNGCTAAMVQSAFMPALGLPTNQLYQGLTPALANSLIYIKGGYTSWSATETPTGATFVTKFTTVLFNSYGVPVMEMPNPASFWGPQLFQIYTGP